MSYNSNVHSNCFDYPPEMAGYCYNRTMKSENKSLDSGREVGYKKPPKDKRFGQPGGNPQGRGFWKKENTPRYKLEQMMKLDEEALKDIANDKSAPLFERRIARSLIKENDFKTTAAMIEQVYGKPKETVETIDRTPKAIQIQVLEPEDNKSDKKGDNK